METASQPMETDEETTTPGGAARPRVGPYDLLREAGRGGMSVVYEAVDRRNGRVVALKVLTPELRLEPRERDELLTRVQREASIVSLLRHPNIVNVLDVGSDGGDAPTRPPVHYLVMEFLDGETLAQRVERAGPMDADQAAEVLEQVAGALDALHGVGIVHRDVKPGNIMLLPDGTAKLMDFGIARHHDDTMTTRAGGIIGSPAYMSPEQALGRPATTLSDLWSLAAVVYTLLAGRPPFQGDNIPSVLYQIIHERPAPLPGLPAPAWAVLDRAFSPNPPHRFLSASEFSEAFREAFQEEPDTVVAVAPPVVVPTVAREAAAMPLTLTPPPTTAPERRAGAGSPAAILVGIGALAAAGGLLVWTAASRPGTSDVAPQVAQQATEQQAPPAVPQEQPEQRPPAAAAEEEVLAADAAGSPEPLSAPTATPRATPTPTPAAPRPSPTPAGRLVVTEKTAPAPRPTPKPTPKPTPPPKPQPRRTPPAPIVITIPPLEERTPSPSSSLPGAGEVMGMRGVWRGNHGGQPAEIVITEENAEADRFSGKMTVRTAAGPVVLEVRGRLNDETGEPVITLEERRVLDEPAPRSWDLGKNDGRLLGAGSMSGRGRDRRGREYSWYFRR